MFFQSSCVKEQTNRNLISPDVLTTEEVAGQVLLRGSQDSHKGDWKQPSCCKPMEIAGEVGSVCSLLDSSTSPSLQAQVKDQVTKY